MTFAALKRLAGWLNNRGVWDDYNQFTAIRKDFMREVIQTNTLSVDEKMELFILLIWGELEDSNDEK